MATDNNNMIKWGSTVRTMIIVKVTSSMNMTEVVALGSITILSVDIGNTITLSQLGIMEGIAHPPRVLIVRRNEQGLCERGGSFKRLYNMERKKGLQYGLHKDILLGVVRESLHEWVLERRRKSTLCLTTSKNSSLSPEPCQQPPHPHAIGISDKL